MKRFIFAVLWLICLTAPAARYRVVPKDENKVGVRFELPYSLGTHEGEASAINGELSFDGKNWAAASGSFSVPIRSLVNGDKKLECHLHESLGLDYEKSEYPDSHVCNSKNELPAEGPDAVVFPQIRFDWKQSAETKVQGVSRIEVKGQWNIHGVTKPANLVFIATPAEKGNGIRLQGTDSVRLADFGIVVKNFLFISVKDTARVLVDAELAPVP